MRPVEHFLAVECAASRAELWRYLANTELLNRFIGSGALETEKIEDPTSASRFVITGKIGGITLRYREEPWHFSEGRFFAFRRDLENGPARTISVRYELREREPSGSQVVVRMALVPRYALLRPFVWLASRNEMRKIGKFIGAIDAHSTRNVPLKVAGGEVDSQRADQCLAELAKKYDAAVLGRVRAHVCEGADFEVLRIRPFELARNWQRDREEVVALCLDAVRIGLLDLNWCTICPSCQTVSETLPSLQAIEGTAHCHACDLLFGMDLVRSVEAVFAPHPTIRRVEERPFCIAGPMLMPHVVAQAVTSLSQPAMLDVPPEAGRYRVFARGGRTAVLDVQPGNPERARVLLHPKAGDTPGRFEPNALDLAPGASLEVATQDPAPCQVKIEQTRWNFDALTALHISALPEFRAQFGEALRPGLALRVGKIAIYFSDLCGSTALYSEVGDAAAFGIVTDCLTYGIQIVKRHGGIVVKTMGDAVMAAFIDSDAAMQAGAASILEWTAFQKRHALATKLDIKVGVAAGPCTIVTANGVLDYFGQTVNSAARIQHLAGPSEFVAARALSRPQAPGLKVIEEFETRVKGVAQVLELVRFGVERGESALPRDSQKT